MRHINRALLILSIAFTAGASGQSWAQTNQAAPQSGSTDEIVKMRMEVASANKTYDKKVAAAKKVYDHKKAEAAKERDAAIAAAHQGAS
jgi:hypothetical protein